VERCAVWLLDDNLNSFRPIAYHVASPVHNEEILQKAAAIWYRILLPLDNPVIHRLVASGGILYVGDLRAEAMSQTLTGFFQTYAVLLVALIHDGKPVGFLSLDNPGQINTFSPEQHQWARAIGQQATIAINNARLYQQAQSQQQRAEHLIERMRAIYQVAMAVNSGEDLSVVLRLATRHLVRVLEAHAGLTLLLDPDEATLRPVDQQDVGHTFPRASIALEELPHFYTVIATGHAVLVHAAQAGDAEMTWFRQFDLKSMLVVPLMVGVAHQRTNWDLPGEQKSLVPGRGEVETLPDAHCVGVIVVSYIKRKRLSSGQYAFAQDIAAQCGLAIEKARLLAATIQAEQRIRMALETFLHTVEAVSYSTDIQSILQGVLAKTLVALTSPRGSVHLFKQAAQGFELLFALGFTSDEEVRWLEEQQTWLNPASGQIFDLYQQIMSGHAMLVNTEHRLVPPQLFEQTMILAAPIIHHQH
ncbi:MAG: GAF domain-containing protein, partial [Ktedonobacteraceae bacterium]